MEHVLNNKELNTDLILEDNDSGVLYVHIFDKKEDIEAIHVLSDKDLNDLIGVLLHIQSKKRKNHSIKR